MKRLIFNIPIALILFSCFDEPDQHYYLANEIKDLGDFNKGSYWIYHNDSLNVDDTLLITGYNHSTSSNSFDSHTNFYEKLSIEYKNSYDSSIVNDYLYEEYTGDFSRTYFKYQKNDTLSRKEFSIYYFSNKNSYYFDYPFSGLLDTIDSYTVNQINYNYVLHFKIKSFEYHLPSHLRDTIATEYYMAKKIGAIKKIYYYPQRTIIWSLIKYKIVN